MPWNEISVILTRSWTGSSPGSPWTTPCVRGDTFVGHSHVVSCFSAASVAEAVKRFLQKKIRFRFPPLCRNNYSTAGGCTQNETFSEFCILSRHLDRFCSSKRPRGPRGPPELPNDKKTAAPRLLDRLLFRYPPPQIRLKWDVLSVTFNGKFQR